MDQRTSLSARRDEVLDRIVDICLSAGSIEAQTDKYFTNTSRIVKANGDSEVTFAVFMRRRVVAALEPTIRLISRLAPGTRVKRDRKSTRLNSSHTVTSYAVFCLAKKMR